MEEQKKVRKPRRDKGVPRTFRQQAYDPNNVLVTVTFTNGKKREYSCAAWQGGASIMLMWYPPSGGVTGTTFIPMENVLCYEVVEPIRPMSAPSPSVAWREPAPQMDAHAGGPPQQGEALPPIYANPFAAAIRASAAMRAAEESEQEPRIVGVKKDEKANRARVIPQAPGVPQIQSEIVGENGAPMVVNAGMM